MLKEECNWHSNWHSIHLIPFDSMWAKSSEELPSLGEEAFHELHSLQFASKGTNTLRIFSKFKDQCGCIPPFLSQCGHNPSDYKSNLKLDRLKAPPARLQSLG
jgi:hypothetical protein